MRRVSCRAEYFALALIAGAHLPLTALHLHNLWVRPHYQFFPFLLAFVGLWVWKQSPRAEMPVGVPRWPQRVLLWLGLLLLGIAAALFSPWLAFIASTVTAAGVVSWYFPKAVWSRLFPAWLLLWLLVPPPFGFDQQLARWLQKLTSVTAGWLLEALAVHHLMEGNVLILPGKTLLIEEACSGIQSLFVLPAFAAVICVWTRRHVLTSATLMLSSVYWATIVNTCRVTFVAIAATWWGYDSSTGWRHDLLGALLFVASAGLLFSTDRFLLFLTAFAYQMLDYIEPLRKRFAYQVSRLTHADHKRVRRTRELKNCEVAVVHNSTRPIQLPWLLIIGFAFLATMQATVFLVTSNSHQDIADNVADRRKTLEALQESSLPAERGQWKRVGFQTERRDCSSIFGEFSMNWSYNAPTYRALVSLDYPFEGWHELSDCYRGQGWTVLGRRTSKRASRALGEEVTCVELELSKPTGECGYVLFALFDDTVTPLIPPENSWSWSTLALSKVRKGPFAELIKNQVCAFSPAPAVYQLQVFVGTDFRLSPSQRLEVALHFDECFQTVCGCWSEGGNLP